MNCWWAVVFLAVFLIGLTKSGFGSGVGLMIVPMMAIALKHIPERGSQAALGLMLPLLVSGDLLAVWQYRRVVWPENGVDSTAGSPALEPASGAQISDGEVVTVDYQPMAARLSSAQATRIIMKLLPGTAVGVVLGGLLLWWIHRQAGLVEGLIKTEIGLESILLVSLHWWRQYKGIQQRLMPEPARSHLTGAFTGISSTLAHAAGPIVAMYLLPLRLDRKLFVGTCAIYFAILNAAKFPAYAASGQFKHAEFSFTVKFLPLVVAGALFGLWVNRRLNDKLFTGIVYIVTFLLGWYILIDGGSTIARQWS